MCCDLRHQGVAHEGERQVPRRVPLATAAQQVTGRAHLLEDAPAVLEEVWDFLCGARPVPIHRLDLVEGHAEHLPQAVARLVIHQVCRDMVVRVGASTE